MLNNITTQHLNQNKMKEFIETVNEYPWTSFFILIGLISIAKALSNKK